MPPPETEGTIKEIGSSQILGLRQKRSCSYGHKISLQDRGEVQFTCEPSTDSQIWFRSRSDADGYFTLKNIKKGQLLTATSKTKFEVTGMLIILYQSQVGVTSLYCMVIQGIENQDYTLKIS